MPSSSHGARNDWPATRCRARWSSSTPCRATRQGRSTRRCWLLALAEPLREGLLDAGPARADRLVEEGAQVGVVDGAAQRVERDEPLGLLVTRCVELGDESVDALAECCHGAHLRLDRAEQAAQPAG